MFLLITIIAYLNDLKEQSARTADCILNFLKRVFIIFNDTIHSKRKDEKIHNLLETGYTLEFSVGLSIQFFHKKILIKQQCTETLNTSTPAIVGREVTLTPHAGACLECCTGDNCNQNLCIHKPSTSKPKECHVC